MTEQDKAAIIGKAVMEHSEVSKEIGMLRARLREIGGQNFQLSQSLQSHPEMVYPTGESVDGRFGLNPSLLQLAQWVHINQVLELTRQLRAALIRQADLERQLTNLGYPIH